MMNIFILSALVIPFSFCCVTHLYSQ